MSDPGEPETPTLTRHTYLSTACQHQLHAHCRATCKFCSTGCACPCHWLTQEWTRDE